MTLLDEVKVYPLGNMDAPYKEEKWCYAVELPSGSTHRERRNIMGLATNFRFREIIEGIILDFKIATGGGFNIAISNGHILLTDEFNFKSPFDVFDPKDRETALHVVTAFFVAADRIKDRVLDYSSTHTLAHRTVAVDVYEPEQRQAHI